MEQQIGIETVKYNIRKIKPIIVHVPQNGGEQRVSCPLFSSFFRSFTAITRILRQPRLIIPYHYGLFSVDINRSSHRRWRTRVSHVRYSGVDPSVSPSVRVNSSSRLAPAIVGSSYMAVITPT